MTVRKRTLAREIVVQLLYQFDVWQKIDGESETKAEAFIQSGTEDPDVREFARTLYEGAVDAIDESDQLIGDVVEHWKPDRIASIDRAILRLAVFELSEMPEIPSKVVLNEAIELSKRFSTKQSGAFINGILDRLLFLRKDETRGEN